MRIDSISLTNKAGKTTTIFNNPTNVEFIVAMAKPPHSLQ